ncbi:[acyl-carrier-protein] S-malonyltransferase [delta proteobacterium NaphS2]|nr:[acyl-carrier-protein] S-malonyltransferase [delta proteobacterium NaphS2]
MGQKTAFLFPGQGSQFVGMGQELLKRFPQVERIFQETDRICGKPVARLCFEGPMPELTLTENCQPAITAVSLACLSVLNESGITADVSAGHSVGECASMVSAGILSENDGLKLVHKRSSLMHRESLSNPGTMAAVLGLDMAAVQEIVADAREGEILDVANHNTALQIVITGQKEAVNRAVQLAKGKKAKAVPLKVSGAWHSGLMQGGVDEFRTFMEDIPFSTPTSEMFFNATARSETDPERIKDIMANQLVSPVRWYDSMRKMLDEGVDTFVEVGPKTVLAGLLKKIVSPDDAVSVFTVQDPEDLETVLEKIS